MSRKVPVAISDLFGSGLFPAAHTERDWVGQAVQVSMSGGVFCPPGLWVREETSFLTDARAFSWSILIWVAPTVMAMAITSFNSSSVAFNSLATARQY